jgi:hypothetical protein
VTSQAQRRRMLDAYRRYRDQALNVLPLCPARAEEHARLAEAHRLACGSPGKVPLGRWRHLQSRRATPEEVRAMVAGAGAEGMVPNLGAVMGVSSGGLVSVDADGPAAVEWCHVALGERLLRTASFRTGRGVRWLFRVPQGAPMPPSRALAAGVELLSAGRQTVLPPSLHSSGVRYAWGPGCDARTWPKRVLPWDMALAPATQVPVAVARRQGLAAEGVPLPEGRRNAVLFGMARALHWRGAGLAEVRACLKVLNRLCVPALSDVDLERIAGSACRYARELRREVGWCCGTWRCWNCWARVGWRWPPSSPGGG